MTCVPEYETNPFSFLLLIDNVHRKTNVYILVVLDSCVCTKLFKIDVINASTTKQDINHE